MTVSILQWAKWDGNSDSEDVRSGIPDNYCPLCRQTPDFQATGVRGFPASVTGGFCLRDKVHDSATLGAMFQLSPAAEQTAVQRARARGNP
jgi:hypothetical protein